MFSHNLLNGKNILITGGGTERGNWQEVPKRDWVWVGEFASNIGRFVEEYTIGVTTYA